MTPRENVRRFFDPLSSKGARRFSLFILALILLSSAGVIVETMPTASERFLEWLRYFEIFAVAVFTIEYTLRIWSAEKPWRKALEPLVIIDLLAILPFFLGIFLVSRVDFRFLRIIRLSRILRIFRLNRYSMAFRILTGVLRDRRHQLVSFLMIAFFILVISASLMFYVEPVHFTSIPHALWWAIVTLTTVGYGDVVPESTFGKLIAGALMMLGIGVVAIPTGIISSGLTEYYYLHREQTTCPSCGNTGHGPKAVFCRICGEELSATPPS